jgi:spheroidene monooxygenase
MQEFAYRHSPHHIVIKDAPVRDWMPESMFVRFEIEAIQGDVALYPKLATLAAEAGIGAGGPILPVPYR